MDYFIYDENLEVTRKVDLDKGDFDVGRRLIEENQRIILYDLQNKRYSEEKEYRMRNALATKEISLLRKMVSREHCRLKRSGKGLEISDLGSKNATYVNNVRVPEGEWKQVSSDFDLLLGSWKFKVYEGDDFTKFSRYESVMDSIDLSSDTWRT